MKIELSKHDRICFFGDSITANGLWIAEIFEYFKKNYPQLEIEFFNCGISGSKGYEFDIKNRLWCDLLGFFPKYIVIMFGMNDIGADLYCPSCTLEDKVQIREKLLSNYPDTILNILNMCEKYDITPILCTPTPYDEYNDLAGENFFANCALESCAKTVRSICNEKNIMLCDMYEIVKNNIDKKPIMPDRTHPNEFGQHLMAERFLNVIGAKECEEIENEINLSNVNKMRYEKEQILRFIMYVERNTMGWQHQKSLTIEERKKAIQKEIDTTQIQWRKDGLPLYLENVDYKDEILGDILKLSKQMYRN